MLDVSCSRVKGSEKIHRFRFGEISPKLVSIEKGLARETERCRNGGVGSVAYRSIGRSG